MEEFNKLYETVYDVLYNGCTLLDYENAVEYYERMVKTNANFKTKLRQLSEYRHDLIMSDREVAAFAIAYCWEG